MIAVVDSGSTKADWAFASADGKIKYHNTMGFNPYFVNEEEILEELHNRFTKDSIYLSVKKIYFYGAGCSDQHQNQIISNAFQQFFKEAEIEVTHDLLGSARALCKNEEGIACILGTGCNSCLYDGYEIIDTLPSPGPFIGDEGSGNFIGKMLLRAYFYRELPDELVTAFEKEYGKNKRAILNTLYGGGKANVYLASFATFIAAHQEHEFINAMVASAFEEFVDRHLVKYEGHTTLPINFVGSIAFHFESILKAVLKKRKLNFGIIIQKPIDNLIDFHLSESEQQTNNK